MSSLVAVSPVALTRHRLLDELAELQRVKARTAAAEARVLADLEALDEVEQPGMQWRRECVSSILRCAPVTASGRLAEAKVLVDRFPSTLSALESGRITPGHVHALLTETDPLDATSAAAVEGRVLARCDDGSVSEFRARVRRAVLTVDPDGEVRRHEAELAQRRVDFLRAGDGITRIATSTGDDTAARVRQHLDACVDTIVQANPDDPRGRDAIRADVLLDLLCGRAIAPKPGASVRAIEVTVALSTLLNLDDLPGEVDGEPVAAPLAIALANDPRAWWRPVLVDRDGHAEALGARTYRPSAMLRRLVQTHDRTCQFPGCRRRATRSDLDHVHPFDHDHPALGGLTEFANLHVLCTRHHRLKHEAGWTVTRKDGITHWRSPQGRSYRKAFEPLLDPVDDPDPPPFWSTRKAGSPRSPHVGSGNGS